MLLLGFVLVLLLLERQLARPSPLPLTTGRNRPLPGRRLYGVFARAAGLSRLPAAAAAGFLLPAGLLLRMALEQSEAPAGRPLPLTLAGNSLTLALLSASLAVALALLLAYSARVAPLARSSLNRLVGLGYAARALSYVPGSVIAVGC